MYTVDVSDLLGSIAPVLGSRGNIDNPSSNNKHRPGVPEDHRVKEVHIVRVEEIGVGFIHAFPLPEEVPRRTLWEMLDLHFAGPVDVVVCGDTHQARIDQHPHLLVATQVAPAFPISK